MALELVGEGGQAAAIGAAVSTTICAVIGKFLLPRWVEAREKFETDTRAAIQECATSREHLDRSVSERLQGIRDHVDSEFKLMRESWHANNNDINKTLGRVAGMVDRNTDEIRGLLEDSKALHNAVHEIDKTAERLEGTMQGMTKALDALTVAVNKRNGNQ